MNLEKVIFGFFLILALTLNLAFVVGARELLVHDSVWIMFAAIVVNVLATILKLGDRSDVGALLLAAALVADLQLLAAALIWSFSSVETLTVLTTIFALAAGALVANVISVTLLVGDILKSGR
jgi:hypothetical protein